MNITEISDLEPTSAIVIYTDTLDTSIGDAIRQGEVGQHGFRFKKEKAAELNFVYLGTPLDIPGAIRTIHLQAKAHITGIVDGDKGVIFKIDQVEECDIMVHARFGDVRNTFMYCDEYHLQTTIQQRQQNAKLLLELKADKELARQFLVKHKPKDLKVPRDQVSGLVQKFMDALTHGVDCIQTARLTLGV